MADPAPPAIDDDTLRAYLAETLSGEEMARVERGLRGSASLRQRLEDVRQDKPESTIHTLGAIWRRARLSCPDREELGSYLLEALDPEHIDYIRFHIDVVECPFCLANLSDLRGQFAADAPSSQTRQRRYFQSSRHLLGSDD
jgi:hypothetical protein